MMIEDDELRNLYKLSGEEHLQKLEAGLLCLEEQPGDHTTIEQLLREAHSLKGDSRAVGLEEVADLTQAIETILKRVQRQELSVTPALNVRLYGGLNAIAQLIHAATTGESSQVNVSAILHQLTSALTQPHQFAAGTSEKEAAAPVPPHPNLIADEELREIYATTSEERLQELESGLVQLASYPTDSGLLEQLRRQIHSLKGDSSVVGVETVATLTQQIENVLKRLQSGKQGLTEAVYDCLCVSLDAIAQFVLEAVTGQPSQIEFSQVLERLQSILATFAESDAASSSPVEFPSDIQFSDTQFPDIEFFDPYPTLEDFDQQFSEPDASSSPMIIEDSELRQVFKASSEERLQTLEAGLAQLEGQPSSPTILAELLRQTHSLKGDSRSAGSKSIETLTHQIEEIFQQIQRQEIALTAAVSDRLYVGLDAIGQLVQEAVTGQPSGVNVEQVLNELSNVVPPGAIPQPDTFAPSEVIESGTPEPALKLDEPYCIDTIRVQTHDLDGLMTQTEELTITRIQIAQTLAQAEQLVSLWEERKAGKRREHYLNSASTSNSTHEKSLESLIHTVKASIQENSKKLDLVAENLREKVYNLRLLPLSTVFQLFPRIVRELARQQSKVVELVIEGGETTADKRILEGSKDALTHLIRNAVDHGIETVEEREKLGKPLPARIWLRSYQSATGVVIEVVDDGRGLDLEQIKQTAIKRRLHRPETLEAMTPDQIRALILTPGFSTRSFITELSGRGVGLDVVQTQVERLKGSIQIESTPHQGCTFRLYLRTSLTSINVVLVELQGIVYALPFEFLQTTLLVSPQQITRTGTQDAIIWNDQPIPVANLFDVLELSKSPAFPFVAQMKQQKIDRRPCLILQVGEELVGVLVDRLLDTQEVVLKPQSRLLKRVRGVLGGTTLASGQVCMILNPADLVKLLQQPIGSSGSTQLASIPQHKPVILLVEDSKPVQIQERRLFEGAGYKVVVANNGLEGYNTLQTRKFDAVVSDIEMPSLDGLSLTTKIRQHPEYRDLPIILVTTLSSDEDRRRGANAGANAYIAKGKFNQEVLLETLAKLI
jgi:two-component system chemotaxis sensor kinase CheA